MAKARKITEKEVCEGLRRLAFGEIKDAVSLLFDTEENVLMKLPELDLYNVSEIKKAKGGGMEIKFFDRLKAIEKLREMMNSDKSITQPSSFFDALEKSAASADDVYRESDYE